MQRIGITALALAIGLVAAPHANAQADVATCRDGSVVRATRGSHSCDERGGIAAYGTVQRNGNGRYGTGAANGTRGVYSGGGTNGTRGVYNGGVYNGGVYGGNSNGQLQCADGSWTTAGAYGCSRHGGVYDNRGNNRGNNRDDGPWYGRQRQSNGRWDNRRDDDDDDDYGDDDRGRGHKGKKDKKHHDNGRGHAYGRDRDDH